MNIEALFEKKDFHAIVFQKYLISTGQISTNTIFSAPAFRSDVAFIKDKVFVFLLKPLLDICDCSIRIDDFQNLSFNFIFTLKESMLPMINAVNQKIGLNQYNLSNLTPELLKGYIDEIHQYNVKKCMEFFRSGYIVGSEKDFLDDISNKAKEAVPYTNHKITLDLFNIARIMNPNWLKYIQTVGSEAREAIQADVRKTASDNEAILRSITELHLYWDVENNTFPNYADLTQKVISDVHQPTRGEVTESSVRRMFQTSDSFFMFKVNKTVLDSDEIRVNLDSTRFQIRKLSSSFSILENGAEIKLLTPKKTNFLQKHIKMLVLPRREVYTDRSFRANCDDKQVFVVYLNKVNDVFARAINSKRYKNVKIVSELFKFPEFSQQKILFESVVQSMLDSIENFVLNKNLLDYLKDFHRRESFFAKIINSFISLWNDRILASSLNEEQAKIDNLSSNILKREHDDDRSKNNKSSEYDPVATMINIISANIKGKQIRQILSNKDFSNDVKVTSILNLYDDIGATSRAVIAKNDKLQNEFLAKIKPLVSPK